MGAFTDRFVGENHRRLEFDDETLLAVRFGRLAGGGVVLAYLNGIPQHIVGYALQVMRSVVLDGYLGRHLAKQILAHRLAKLVELVFGACLKRFSIECSAMATPADFSAGF